MIKLYSSNSSEFFAVREPGRIHLFKDSFQDITHRVHDKMAGELIHLSDAGECFFRSDEGLFRLRREKGVRADRCKAVRGLDGSPEGGVLKGFAVRHDGEQVAYEQVLPAQRFSSKLKRFLGQKSAQGDVGPRLHRFVLSQWSGRSSTCYYETVVDPRTSLGLVWWTSADFGFLAVMEREREGRSLLRLIDVFDESEVNDGLAVEGRLSRDRFLTRNGSVGFGVEKGGKRAFIIWTYSHERFAVTYPRDARVLHLSKDRVVFLSRKTEVVTVKDYNNQTVDEVSLKALTTLGVEYHLSFNPRGTLELVTYHSGKLRVHHTDLEALPIDARRWELLGERRRAEQMEEAAMEVLKGEDHVASQKEFQLRQAELMAELPQSPPEPTPPSVPSPPMTESPPAFASPLDSRPDALSLEGDLVESAASHSVPTPEVKLTFASKDDAEDALERLRMRYIAGELTREDYYNEKTLIERASSKIGP